MASISPPGTIPSRRSTVPDEAPGPPVAEHRMTWPAPPTERCALLSTRMGTEEFTLKTEARSSALVSLQSPPEQASHPTTENIQQTIRANYAILPSGPKSNFLFLIPLFPFLDSYTRSSTASRPSLIGRTPLRNDLIAP